MKVVFISGPYTGPSYIEIDHNIAAAREMAAWLAENGIGFFCPHLNSAHFEVVTPSVGEDFWRELDLKFLKVCHAMIMLEGWEHSEGAQRERQSAKERGWPIFEDPLALLAWSRT